MFDSFYEMIEMLITTLGIILLTVLLLGGVIFPIVYFSAKNQRSIINPKYNLHYSVWDYMWNGDSIMKTVDLSKRQVTLKMKK